jgi:hypothetical protein
MAETKEDCWKGVGAGLKKKKGLGKERDGDINQDGVVEGEEIMASNEE